MKYVIISYIKNCIQENKFIIFMHFFILLAYTCLQKIIGFDLNNDLIYSVFGLNCSYNSSLLRILIYIYNISFFLFIMFNLFKHDIKRNSENIFLRMNIKKWFLIKIMSLGIINLLIKLISYFIILFCFNIINMHNIFITFFIDNYSTIFIQFMFLVVYLLLEKKFYFIIILFGLINYEYLIINFMECRKYLVPSFVLLLILFLILINSKKSKYIFEKID